MKGLIAMTKLTLMALLLFSSMASAHIVEVNETERMIYFTPTLTLDVELTDLKEAGGMLALSLRYERVLEQFELKEVRAKYPEYEVQTLAAEQTEEPAKLSLLEVGISEEVQLRRSQAGPYLNYQRFLSSEQVSRLKELVRTERQIVRMKIPMKTAYPSKRIVEVYEDGKACAGLRGPRVVDFIQELISLKKPDSIRYPQTFVAYKKALLQNCFEITPATVRSFQELLEMPLKTKSLPSPVVGSYSEHRMIQSSFDMVPRQNLQIR